MERIFRQIEPRRTWTDFLPISISAESRTHLVDGEGVVVAMDAMPYTMTSKSPQELSVLKVWCGVRLKEPHGEEEWTCSHEHS